MLPVIKLSVHTLVEHAYPPENLRPGGGMRRLVEGTRLHQLMQKNGPEGYTAEVIVSRRMEFPKVILDIGGRIDGMFYEQGQLVVEELKSCLELPASQDALPRVHEAQLQCYAAIYLTEHQIDSCIAQWRYRQVDTGQERAFRAQYHAVQLETILWDLCQDYADWATMLVNWQAVRDASILTLTFPFAQYRPGQREMVEACYRAVRDQYPLFIQAPTGIGKTAATLYPALQALARTKAEKIFYLTAKTSARSVARNTLTQLMGQGLNVKYVVLTARDKICPFPATGCQPELCPLANGYGKRIRAALHDAFATGALDQEAVLEVSRRHEVCPFELQLDVSEIVDVVVCDYNYVFDPRVRLRRFFDGEGGGDFVFLIDEAHNLVERAREMYSAELQNAQFLAVRKQLKSMPEAQGLLQVNREILTWFATERVELREQQPQVTAKPEPPEDLTKLCRQFVVHAEPVLGALGPSVPEAVMDAFFACIAFQRTAEGFDPGYLCYTALEEGLRVKLFCMDPSTQLAKVYEFGRAPILFSATLHPLQYYMRLLGGGEGANSLDLPSPFDPDNCAVLAETIIATDYRTRAQTYGDVADCIRAVVCAHPGKYLAFFPSYAYLRQVAAVLQTQEDGLPPMLVQRGRMSEQERQEYLDAFIDPKRQRLLGLAVMGGVFAEGIDLPGEQLSGAIVVGVGLPQIGLERDILRAYFNETEEGMGFVYAYVYPGLNRVQQAAGRVIRTDSDRGVIVLIDRRYEFEPYNSFCQRVWPQSRQVQGAQTIAEHMEEFWG